MKSILHFLLLLSVSCLLLSCHTTKASVSASEKSETVATSADRLSSSLMTDSINITSHDCSSAVPTASHFLSSLLR